MDGCGGEDARVEEWAAAEASEASAHGATEHGGCSRWFGVGEKFARTSCKVCSVVGAFCDINDRWRAW